jgi:uncharacterized membrane protein YoaK (UPF0700 family)
MVEAIAAAGLFGLLPLQVGAALPQAATSLILQDQDWFGKALAVPVFLLTVAIGARRLARAPANRRLASGYLLFFQTMLLLAAMAAGVLGAPFASPDAASAILASLFAVMAMALQTLGALTLWPRRSAPLGAHDLARLAARTARARRSISLATLLRLTAYLAGVAVGAMAWRVAGFWSLGAAAFTVMAALFCFVPFDFARAAADHRRR